MAAIVKIGDWVRHERYGDAIVRKVQDSGRTILVELPNMGGNQCLNVSEISVLNSDGTIRAPKPVLPSAKINKKKVDLLRNICQETPEERKYQALKVIEALRSGIVPSSGAKLYTVGREIEMQAVEEDLDLASQRGAVRVFSGDYGTGKTHLLECIRERALESNFLVCRAVIDKKETALCNAKRVYRMLLNNLSYPPLNSPETVETYRQNINSVLHRLFSEAAGQVKSEWLSSRGASYHRYFSPVLRWYKMFLEDNRKKSMLPQQLEEEFACLDVAVDWVSGHPTNRNEELQRRLDNTFRLEGKRRADDHEPLMALPDYVTLSHMYTYLITGISRLAHEVGYSGLCLLFDELDLFSVANSKDREHGLTFIKYLLAACLGTDSVTYDANRLPRGGQPPHKSLNPLNFAPNYLYSVFVVADHVDHNDDDEEEEFDYSSAVARQDHINAILRLFRENLRGGDAYIQELQRLKVKDYQELCRVVLSLYRQAYPDFSVSAGVEKAMGLCFYNTVRLGSIDTPRQVLKEIVEMLDYTRLCRDNVTEYIREFMDKAHINS